MVGSGSPELEDPDLYCSPQRDYVTGDRVAEIDEMLDDLWGQYPSVQYAAFSVAICMEGPILTAVMAESKFATRSMR